MFFISEEIFFLHGMRFFFRKIIPLFCLLVLQENISVAQSDFLHFKKYSTTEGLTSNDTRALLQDSYGYLWIATTYGLNRYDGFSFQNFRHSESDTNSLLSNSVHSMVQLNSEFLVLGCDIGVSVFNLKKNCFQNSVFKWPANFPKKINAECVLTDSNKNLWIQHDNKLEVFDSAFHYRFCFSDSPIAGAIKNCGGVRASGAVTDTKGNLWIPAFDVGIVKISKSLDKVELINLSLATNNSHPDTRSIFIDDKNSTIWFSYYGEGLISFNYLTKETHQYFKVPPLEDPPGLINTFNSIIPFQNKLLLCGEGGLLSSFDLRTKKFSPLTSPSDELSHPINYGFELLMDADSNLWYASNGLYKTSLKKKIIKVVRNDLWLDEIGKAPELISMAQWNSDTLLIGTDENGLLIYNLKTRAVGHLNFSDSKNKFLNSVTCIFVDREKRIWLGVGPKLFLFNIKNGTYTEAPRKLKATSNEELYCAFEDSRNNLWFSYRDLGFVRCNADGSINTSNDLGFRISNLKCIREDARQNIWLIANYNHFYKYNPVSGNYFSYPDSSADYYPQEFLSGVEFNGENILWLASRAGHGLIEYDLKDNRTKFFGKSNGLDNERVYSLLKYDNGNFWMLTNSGIATFNLSANRFKNFNLSNEVMLDDALQFIFSDKLSGNIFMLARNAVIYFSPVELIAATKEKPIYITGVKVNGKDLRTDFSSPLHFDYNENQFSIQFTSVNYSDEGAISFYTKLEEADDDFVNAGKSREVNLRNLAPGNYKFLVRTSDGEALSKNFASFEFSIASPWWRALWFYFICVLLIAGILYAIYRYRVDKLMVVMELRNRISRDLHDEVGSTLSSISMLSKVAGAEENNKEAIEMIGNSSQRMMNAMDDIVWSINPRNDEMKFLAIRLKEVAAEILEPADINYELKISNELNEIKIPMEKRRELYLIYKEAINNIAKYSKCAKAIISFRKKSNQLVMEISDDGCGFDVEKISSGNGLTSMKERAAILKADLKIISSQGNGTKIILTI